jgi:hypothetical protein
MLNRAEKSFHVDLGKYSERKKTAIERLQNMDPSLRDREHRYCMKIWSTVVGERDSRRYLEQISQSSEHIKKALELAYQHVHYSGQGQMRYYNGFVMKLWKQVHIRLTGSTLRLGHENSAVNYGVMSSDQQQQHQQPRRKSSMNQVMDCMDDTLGQAKSRTIMIDSIDSVEVSLKLPLFPRVQQAMGTRRASATSSSSSSSVDATSAQDQATKVFFIFYFKSAASQSHTAGSVETSSPHLKKQRERSQAPPKHPIVLSLNAVAPSSEGGVREHGPVAFLKSLRAAMPEVDIAGTACLMATDTVQEYLGQPSEGEYSFSNMSESQSQSHSHHVPTQPLGRSSESQVYSPSEWSHLGSGRTSVESLLTASGSVDSHRARSSHSSSHRRSTLSSMDDSVSEQDQQLQQQDQQHQHHHQHQHQQVESTETRKRPCALGSVIEERESRYSNDSHSSHSQSRNNSNSVLSNGGGRLPFSNDVLMEHNRYLYHESVTDLPLTSPTGATSSLPPAASSSSLASLQSLHSHGRSRGSEEDSLVSSTLTLRGGTSPKRVVERNGILSCENTSNVDEDDLHHDHGGGSGSGGEGGFVDVEWASVESDKLDSKHPEDTKKNYQEFADTPGGSSTHHQGGFDFFSAERSRSRTLSLEVHAVMNHESAVASQPLISEDIDRDAGLPATPATSRRPSLLALSLQSTPTPAQTSSVQSPESVLASTLTSKLSHLSGGQMSYSEPLTHSEAMDRMISSAEEVQPLPPPGPDLARISGATAGLTPAHLLRSTPISISNLPSAPPSQLQSLSESLNSNSRPLFVGGNTDHNMPLSSPSEHDPYLSIDSESSSVLDVSSFLHDRHSMTSLPLPPPPSLSLFSSRDKDGRSRPPPAAARSMSVTMDSLHESHPRPSPSFQPPNKHPSLSKTFSADRLVNRNSTRHSISTVSSHVYSNPPAGKKQASSTTTPSLLDGARPVSHLLRALSKVRSNRDVIQTRLVKFITEREAFLEILHYLQSLRTLVKSPPTTPLLYKPNSTPDSVLTHIKRINRKAFSLLTLTRHSEDCHKEVRQQSADEGSLSQSLSMSMSGSQARGRGMSSLSNVDEECFYNEEQASTDPAHFLGLDLHEERQFSVEDESKFASIRDLDRERGNSDNDLLLVKGSYEAETFVNKMLDSSTSFIANTQEASMMGNSFQSNDSGRFISFENDVIDGQEYISPPPPLTDGAGSSHCCHPRVKMNSPHPGVINPPPTLAMASSNTSDDIAGFFREDSDVDPRGSEARMSGGGARVPGDSGSGSGSGISSLAQLGAPPREVLDMHAV